MEPLDKSSTSFSFVSLPSFEMSFVIEVVVDLAVITDKFLERCYRSEALHRALSSSKRQVRILASVVGSATT